MTIPRVPCALCGRVHDKFGDECPSLPDSVRGKPVRVPERARVASTVKNRASEPSPKRKGTSLQGTTVNGTYKVGRLVGVGGMGTVYQVHRVDTQALLAMKVLHQTHAGRKDSVIRFYREARAAGSIGHPNICRIYEVGVLENGCPYMVMEYLEGQTLGQRIQANGPLPFQETSRMITQVLSALGAAHGKNIIHRDVKPDNIFLIDGPTTNTVKVLDFGVSKDLGENVDETTVTRVGVVVGTPYYMAPEQARGDTLDRRVDIYACGVVLYECLTGRRPFFADNCQAVMMMIQTMQPVDPSKIRPAVPNEFVNVILKATAKKPADRYPDAASFLQALRQIDSVLERGPGPDEIRRILAAVRRGRRYMSGAHDSSRDSSPSDSAPPSGYGSEFVTALAPGRSSRPDKRPSFPGATPNQTIVSVRSAPRASTGDDNIPDAELSVNPSRLARPSPVHDEAPSSLDIPVTFDSISDSTRDSSHRLGDHCASTLPSYAEIDLSDTLVDAPALTLTDVPEITPVDADGDLGDSDDDLTSVYNPNRNARFQAALRDTRRGTTGSGKRRS